MAAGYDLYLIVTEPNGLETLLNAMKIYNIPPERLRYRVIEPARPGFDALLGMAQKVTMMGFEALRRWVQPSASKAQFLTLVGTFNNFIDDRTGQAFGDVSKLPPSVRSLWTHVPVSTPWRWTSPLVTRLRPTKASGASP